MAQIIPVDLSSLALTDGERALTNALFAILDHTWTIYVQPYLNGMRPDIVIFSEQAGIGIFEVKDWNLAAYEIEVTQPLPFAPPLARGGVGGGVDYTWRVRDMATGERKSVECPLRQVNRYRRSIYKYEIPILDSHAALDKSIYSLVSTFVYFHKHTTAQVREKLAPIMGEYDTVFGNDDLPALREILHARGMRKRPKLAAWMAENTIVERVRGAFSEPEHGKTSIQNLMVKFTARQRDLLPNTPGRRRVLGVAGSGKTIIIAHKAAAAAREGKNVLIVCYNITMANYLKDLTRRLARQYGGLETYRRIQVGHYHRWFSGENQTSPLAPSLLHDEGEQSQTSTPAPLLRNEEGRQNQTSPLAPPLARGGESGEGLIAFDDDETAPVSKVDDTVGAQRAAPLQPDADFIGVLREAPKEETLSPNPSASASGRGENSEPWREIVQPVDVLLIDEGQDFERVWLENLLNVCQPAHFMFMEDDRQDIYGRVEQRGRQLPGVTGRPYILNETFRIPREIARLGDDYAVWAQMNDESGQVKAEKPDLTSGLFAWNYWFNGTRERCLKALRDDLADLIATGELRAPADTAILVCSVADGWDISEALASLNLPLQTNFESRAEFEALRGLYDGGDFIRMLREVRRGYKAGFWMQGGRIKICTIHSFKGWELGRILVMFNPVYETGKHNLLYTAMTRSQGYLTVYNCDPTVDRFGQVAIQRGLMKARFDKAWG